MAEIMTAIALLCQVHTASLNIKETAKVQQECQKKLTSCVYLSFHRSGVALARCVAEIPEDKK